MCEQGVVKCIDVHALVHLPPLYQKKKHDSLKRGRLNIQNAAKYGSMPEIPDVFAKPAWIALGICTSRNV